MSQIISPSSLSDVYRGLSTGLLDYSTIQMLPVHRYSIDVQGAPKSGKSHLLFGCPDMLIIRFPDGCTLPRRCRAKIVEVHNLGEFNQVIARTLDYARKNGVNGEVSAIAIDPIFRLYEWLCDELIAQTNEVRRQRWERDVAAGRANANTNPFVPAREMSELQYGSYAVVANQICDILQSFKALGWGWATTTHYRRKLTMDERGKPIGMEWQPQIAPTVAANIARLADILVVTEARAVPGGAGRLYVCNFLDERNPEIGGRLPISRSEILLPNYDDPKTDISQLSWDVFEAAVKDGQRLFTEERSEFLGVSSNNGTSSPVVQNQNNNTTKQGKRRLIK